MGSITEFKLGVTHSITKEFDAKGNGKKLIKIVRDSDGKILTFASPTPTTSFTSTGWVYEAVTAPRAVKTITQADYDGILNVINSAKSTDTLYIYDAQGNHLASQIAISSIKNTGGQITSPPSALNLFPNVFSAAPWTEASTHNDNDPVNLIFTTVKIARPGHKYSEAQIIHEFEIARHFHGVNGNGNVDPHVTAPFGTINPTQITGLSDGDVIQLRIGYTGSNSGPATVPYTIPVGSFTTGTPGYTGNFVASGAHEKPKGTAAEKEAEYGRIGAFVSNSEFADQTHLTEVVLPNTKTFGTLSFASSPITHIEIPSAEHVLDRAFWYTVATGTLRVPVLETVDENAFMMARFTGLIAPKLRIVKSNGFQKAQISRLDLPELTWIGDDAFRSCPLTYLNMPKLHFPAVGSFAGIVNASTTNVIMPLTFNSFYYKNHLFGPGNWDLITFTYV